MISYEPLRILLVKEKLKMQDLKKDNVVNSNIAATLNNDTGYVNLSTIDKVCNYLTKKTNRVITINNIVEFIPN